VLRVLPSSRKLELGIQAQTKEEKVDIACQMVAMRTRIQRADKMVGQYPEDEGVLELRSGLDGDIVKYRRMVESFLRGGAREHIKDMK
jgi:hypothetical protein